MFLKIFNNRKMLYEIITLAMPVVGEMSLNTLLGIVDTILISYLISKDALSAAGFTNQIVFTIIFVFTAFNVGASAMISRALGESDRSKMEDVAFQAFLLNSMIGVIITLLAITTQNALFSIFDLTPQVHSLMKTFFFYISLGMFPMFVNMTMTAILRGAGNTQSPLKITFVSNIINAVLAYTFIVGLGPFPAMGIAGAAIATTIARWITMFMFIRILIKENSTIQLRRPQKLFSKDIIKPMFEISLPSAFEQAFMQISFLVVSVFISSLDTVSEAAFRILVNLESLSFMPAVGLSIAAATLTGKALGEKNKEKAFQSGKMTSTLGVMWGIIAGSCFIVFPSPMIQVFSSDPGVLDAAWFTLIIAGINQPVLNYLISTSGVFRGAGYTRPVMFLTLFRLWAVNVPLSWYFIFVMKTGLAGVWYAEIISFTIASTIMFTMFIQKKWQHIQL